MPTFPIRNNAVMDDDESQSGLESQSGIFTTDGQSTVRGLPGGATAAALLDTTTVVRAYDTTFDESLVSGIDDASFLMNESLYKGSKAPSRAIKDEENMVRTDYSLDDSSLDLADYISMRNHYRQSAPPAAGNLNVSTDAMAPTTNPSFMEDSIFSGAYNRVLKTFMFQGKGSSNKRSTETNSDEDSQGETTPKTLSPKDSQDVEIFHPEGVDEADDVDSNNDTTSVGRPKTIILGKAPRTPQQAKGKRPADTPRTVSSTVMTNVSDTKILGLRLSRLVILILFILVAAVAVAVGSAVASQKRDASKSAGASAGLGPNNFPTSAPVVASGTQVPTYYSTGFEEVDGDEEDDGGDDGDNQDDEDTTEPTAAPVPATTTPLEVTGAPVVGPNPTAAPFSSPTGNPTALPVPTTAPTVTVTNLPTQVNGTDFPVEICGGDDDESTFMLFSQPRDCPWFR